MNNLNMAIAALFLTTSSFATVDDSKKLYVTAGAMYVTSDELDVLKTTGVTIDDNDITLMFTVGYPVYENLSLEAGVIGASDVSATLSGSESGTLNGKSYSISGALTIKAETDTSYTLGAKYGAEVYENFDLYGKAGILFWDLKGIVSAAGTLTYDGASYSGSGTAQFYQNDGNDPYYGVGGSYKVAKDTAINVDYIKMEVDDGDVDGLSMAVTLDF